jgi:hypothetical protein
MANRFAVALGAVLISVVCPAAPRTCSSGIHIATFDLRAVPPEGGEALPLRQLNVAPEGYQLHYTPSQLPIENPGRARVALMVMEASEGRKVHVLEAVPADKSTVWVLPARSSVVGLVFGPQGLDKKKVRSFVVEDADLMAQLAEYADKTSQAENLAQALTAYGRGPNSSQNLEGALRGFSNAWGLPMSRIDSNMPLEQQAAIMLRTLNPALSNFDPLAPQSSVRMAQTANMAAAVAGLFFGPTVGLAAGSTSLFLNLRTALFPNMDFRSAFAQPNEGKMVLCGQREMHRPRTRLAYLWATKLPDLEEPSLALQQPAYLPLSLKSRLSLESTRPLPTAVLSRARIWHVRDVASGGQYLVSVTPVESSGRRIEVEFDPSATRIPPGKYGLHAMWDWKNIEVEGELYLHELPDLSAATPTAASRDRLIQDSGPVLIELEGTDFEFVRKVALRSRDDRNWTPMELEILGAPRQADGTAPSLSVQIDTRRTPAGHYLLQLEQLDGNTTSVPLSILPPNPVLTGLPVRVNQGEDRQEVVLRGERLDRIESVEADGVDAELLAGSPQVRKLRVSLPASAARGTRIGLRFRVEGLLEPLSVEGVLEVVGPRPRIRYVSASPQPQLGINVSDKELVTGVSRSYSLRVEGLAESSRLHAECDSRAVQLSALTLRPGESVRGATLQRAGQDTLFLTLEPGVFAGPGCELSLRIENEVEGSSDRYLLGAVTRVPRIERFEFTEERLGENLYVAQLYGTDLDTIEKAGWSSLEGHLVAGLPMPVADKPGQQMLRIVLPWPAPSPRAPLYVFLRGEATGRLTSARL